MKNNYPGLDWSKIVPYNLDAWRATANGAPPNGRGRRNVARLGVEPLMTALPSSASVKWARSATREPVRAVLQGGSRGDARAISAAARDRH